MADIPSIQPAGGPGSLDPSRPGKSDKSTGGPSFSDVLDRTSKVGGAGQATPSQGPASPHPPAYIGRVESAPAVQDTVSRASDESFGSSSHIRGSWATRMPPSRISSRWYRTWRYTRAGSWTISNRCPRATPEGASPKRWPAWSPARPRNSIGASTSSRNIVFSRASRTGRLFFFPETGGGHLIKIPAFC